MHKAVSSFHYGTKTAAGGTEINVLIRPRVNSYTRLTAVTYRAAATAHTITAMRAFAKTTVSIAAAGSQAVVNITADAAAGLTPGAIAAGDWLVVALDDGTFHLGKVLSVASLAITLTANLPSAAAVGRTVWMLGAPGDHTAGTPTAGSQFPAAASVLNSFVDAASGICVSNEQNSPLAVHSNNATNAGTFELIAGNYTLGS